MKTRLRTILFTGGSILLAAAPIFAQQQQVAAVARNSAVALERKLNNTPSIAEQRARMSDLRKRKAALARYLATIPPGSPDYKATAGAISKLDAELSGLVKLLGEEPRVVRPMAAPIALAQSPAAKVSFARQENVGLRAGAVNVAALTTTDTVLLAPPQQPPTISGTLTQGDEEVTGQARPGSTVELFINDRKQ
ncbi:MAG TPA: hypothetical protein VJ715_11930, partial [Pyrinomonadaceae bacterium]|nr:hypothetical protein [Pyrinomonadaceae bacterium]